MKGYRQMLDAYLLPAKDDVTRETRDGRASFGAMPLRDLSEAKLKAWYDKLPYGRTSERLLVVASATAAPSV